MDPWYLTLLSMLYSHLATKCPCMPAFFQCSTAEAFNHPREISSMDFYFRYPPLAYPAPYRAVLMFCRRTPRADSKLTPLYAVARALLRHAVRELRLGEPYVSWARFEANHSWKELRRSGEQGCVSGDGAVF